MWETIRGYLTFTRKERFGVLFLLLLISVLFVAPYFLRPAIGSPDPEAGKKYKDAINRFENETADSPANSIDRFQNQNKRKFADDENRPDFPKRFEGKMFFFDPNTTSASDWKKLGIADRLIKTIFHYEEKGGHFFKATDLQKLYGLHQEDFQRLMPFIRIRKPPPTGNYGRQQESEQTDHGYAGYAAVESARHFHKSDKSDSGIVNSDTRNIFHSGFAYLSKRLEPTDINKADSVDWCRLPGIGAKLASRIIHFRDRLGGFYNIDQVGETFGLPDSSFQKIRSCLFVHALALHQIDLNMASKETLESHPYIRWQITKSILDYRLQHGGFKSVDEIRQLAQVDADKFQKIKPYLTVCP
jgi:competence protein ComEA